MAKNKSKCSGYGMFTQFCILSALSIVTSVLIAIPIIRNESWDGSLSEFAALIATGIGAAYILLAVVDAIRQRLALKANPLPEELDLSERAVAAEQLAALTGCSLIQRHSRRLLAAWAAGASGPQVATMATNQMLRMFALILFETGIVFALLQASGGFNPPQVLLTLGTGFMVLLVIIALARFQLASQIAGYIESNLVARIGNDTPAAATQEFVQILSQSVASATDSITAAQKIAADNIAAAQKLAADQLANAQEQTAASIVKVQETTAASLAKVQQDTASQLAKSQDNVAEQLGRVSDLSASIENIFNLQKAVDGAIQGVALNNEFQTTLAKLQEHLAASDELMKAVAKPRAIRLVEKEYE